MSAPSLVLVVYLVFSTGPRTVVEPVLMRTMPSEAACKAAEGSTPKETPGWMVSCLTQEQAAMRRLPSAAYRFDQRGGVGPSPDGELRGSQVYRPRR